MSYSDLLSQSDNALQQAQRENKISHWIDADQPQKYNREQWRNKLVDSIHNDRFIFQWQPILSMNSEKVIQRELYCRLIIDENIVTAAEFMPFVELLSLGSQLDKCLLESIKQQNILALAEEGVAINLTNESLLNLEFHKWLTEYLKQSKYVERISFEFTESSAIGSFDSCFHLAEIIKAAGAKVGIDQCGRQIGSLEYLQKLQPNYIKLDLSFAYYGKLNQNKELCRALVNVAKGLQIDVIITGIENNEQLAHFNLLKAEGYQGYISPVEDILIKS
jgi:EAL domain-containing protein (putative c-di-GMP-specific phosphodiesterase class I)